MVPDPPLDPPPVTTTCVLRRGGDYTPEHVLRLYTGVVKHWPLRSVQQMRFVVLTDMEVSAPGIEVRLLTRPHLQGWWAKVELFAPEHRDLGNILYFDLDTMIVGDLDDIIAHAEQSQVPTLLSDFYRLERINSGMMAFNAAVRTDAWATWEGHPPPNRSGVPAIRHFKRDGDWMDGMWRPSADRWQDVVPGQVVSYKVHCRHPGAPPPEARVVCFHGHPRPWRTNFWHEFQ